MKLKRIDGTIINEGACFEESGQRNSDSEVKFYADGDLKSTHKFYDINDIHKLHKMIKSYLGEVK